jgi:hypothetical protein
VLEVGQQIGQPSLDQLGELSGGLEAAEFEQQ